MDKTMIYNSSDLLGYSQPDSKYLEKFSFEFKALQWIIQGHVCKVQYKTYLLVVILLIFLISCLSFVD